MLKAKDFTYLHWLAPSLARDGLIQNSAWIPTACAEAVGLYSDQRLHLGATLLAALDRFAIDYIRQAPVLVLAATWGSELVYRSDRLEVARRFIAACSHRPRLNELMKGYDLAPQLRALSGQVLRCEQWDTIKALCGVPAAALAQSTPKAPEAQEEWLRGLEAWRSHMRRCFGNRELFLEWAAVNMRGRRMWRTAAEVADFAGNNRATFDVRWSFARAKAESDRWHEEIARRPYLTAAMAADWRAFIDYAPLPSLLEVGGFAFHALQTREDIYIEGERMHHCVRTYADRVARGPSRIYSVRRDGQRVATLELCRISRGGSGAPKYVLNQLKGPCNANPATEVAAAALAFTERANAMALAPPEAPPQAAPARADPRLLEARRRIHLALAARLTQRAA